MKTKQKGSIAIQPQYAILRFAKYKGPEIGRIEAHNERTKETYASNPDVDTSRSKYNFHLIEPQGKYRAEAERQIASEIIREKALRHLHDEVPHGIGVEIMRIEKISDALTEIHATIYCERDAHKGIIIGRHGSMLQAIGSEARSDIEKLLDTHVNLKLWVKIRPDWRNNPSDLKNLGYEK